MIIALSYCHCPLASAQSKSAGNQKVRSTSAIQELREDKIDERIIEKNNFPALDKIIMFCGEDDSNSPSSKLVSSKNAVTNSGNKSRKANQAIFKTADGRELWGNVVFRSDWETTGNQYGVYSFNASSPLTIDSLGLSSNLRANGGSALIDGKFHSMYLSRSYSSAYLYHSVFDANTWEQIGSRASVSDLSLAALETAVDLATGTVFGEFYNSTLDGYELGIIDYNTLTRTKICTTDKLYAALGLSKERILYGVASDGNLYKINVNTGEETLVGSTGLDLTSSSGSYYLQSGEIDQETNTFYWAAFLGDKTSELVTVNLETAEVSVIGEFPYREQIYGLMMPQAAVTPSESAPAAATNITATFNGGSTAGTIAFTAPSQTVGGSALSGEMDYTVYSLNGAIATGKASAGESVQVSVDVIGGQQIFVVVFSNESGNGSRAVLNQYVGSDIPMPATDVNLTIDSTTGVANLTWTAPTTGVNGGYIGTLTYNVVRYPDNTTVATGLTETSFSETLEAGELKSYYYGVVAVSGENTSEMATSNNAFFGDALSIPYSQSFDTQASTDLYTIIDANGDGYTWTYNSSDKLMQYSYNSKNDADDWLITAPLKLEKDRIYEVSFAARSRISSYPEKIEVKYGTNNTVDGMTDVLLSEITLPGSSTVYSGTLIPQTDQPLYLGFHAISDKNMYYLYLDDIQVTGGYHTNAPDSVNTITITPDATGASKATVSFNAPDKNCNGTTLSEITTITVSRGGEVVKTFDNPTVGSTLSFEDNVGTNGSVTYEILASNSYGSGRTASATHYVGLDIPLAVESFTATDRLTAVELNWDKVSSTGVNGGVVDPDNVVYHVYNILVDGTSVDTIRIESVRDNTCTLDDFDTTEGEQDLVQFGVMAENEAGQSDVAFSSAIIEGAPYSLPAYESLPGGEASYFWYIQYSGSGYSYFDLATDVSYDNDGGSFAYYKYSDTEIAWLNSGKYTLEGTTNPGVVFAHYSSLRNNPLKFTLEMRTPDGEKIDAYTVDYSNVSEINGWTREVVMFPEEYKSLPYVLISFRGEGGSNSLYPVYIDDIAIRDIYDNDLKVNLSASESMTKGTKETLNVTVINEGLNAASNYTVKVYADGEEVASVDATESLASLASTVYYIDYTPESTSQNSEVTLTAEIVYNSDSDETNNKATVTAALTASSYAAPTNLTTSESDGDVVLNWVAPEYEIETVTDDFESYTSWTIDDFGDWSTVDGDKGAAGNIFLGVAYEHRYEPFAYIVFNPYELNYVVESNPTVAAHSGEQYAAAIYSGNTNTGETYDTSDWLISPRLSGEEQVVSFYANNLNTESKTLPETFDVLYSVSGTDTLDFVKIGDTYTVSSANWDHIEVTIPEGAHYFAIHHNTKTPDAFVFMLDDITYRSGENIPVGYNIYRDGEKIGTVDKETVTFTDTDVPEGVHKYSVTALYDKGESAPVEETMTTVIGNVSVDADGNFTIYSVDGKTVGRNMKTLKKLQNGVFIVNGKKVVVK